MIKLSRYNFVIPRYETTEADKDRAIRLGKALKDAKGKKELSIQQISSRSGVPYQTVRAILSGKSAGPSLFHVAGIAAALDVKLDKLVRAVE